LLGDYPLQAVYFSNLAFLNRGFFAVVAVVVGGVLVFAFVAANPNTHLTGYHNNM